MQINAITGDNRIQLFGCDALDAASSWLPCHKCITDEHREEDSSRSHNLRTQVYNTASRVLKNNCCVIFG